MILEMAFTVRAQYYKQPYACLFQKVGGHIRRISSMSSLDDLQKPRGKPTKEIQKCRRTEQPCPKRGKVIIDRHTLRLHHNSVILWTSGKGVWGLEDSLSIRIEISPSVTSIMRDVIDKAKRNKHNNIP